MVGVVGRPKEGLPEHAGNVVQSAAATTSEGQGLLSSGRPPARPTEKPAPNLSNAGPAYTASKTPASCQGASHAAVAPLSGPLGSEVHVRSPLDASSWS